MQVSTKTKTMKKVWEILKDLKLHKLLSGEKTNIDFINLADQLLSEGKLNQFCQIITENAELDIEEMEIKEVVDIIKNFFGNIGDAFKGVKGFMNLRVQPKQKNPKNQKKKN